MSKTPDTPTMVGYWWSKESKDLPKPVARPKPWKGQRAFLKGLKRIERRARKNHYKGWSNCRVCGCQNGSSDYNFRQDGVYYIWPNGLRHYVVEHNVKPPNQEFIDFVTNFEQPKEEAPAVKTVTPVAVSAVAQLAAGIREAERKRAEQYLRYQRGEELPPIDDITMAFHKFHSKMASISINSIRNPDRWRADAESARNELRKALDNFGLAQRINWDVPKD
jgi:hypothetical protein